MSLMRRMTWIVSAITAAGCGVMPPVQVTSPFSQSEVAPYLQAGSNVLAGQAFLPQVSGRLVTCAGQAVVLMPDLQYYREVVKVIASGRRLDASSLQPAAVGAMRREACDASGSFNFRGLPDGRYIVMTRVVWGDGPVPQGGDMAEIVAVRGQSSVVLSSAQRIGIW